MTDGIIVGIIIVVCFFGIRSGVKHFKGQGGCCGGSSVPKQKKKVIRDVQERKLIHMEGLHCENCKNSVEKAINSIEGVAAKVNLKEQTAEIVLNRAVPDAQLKEVVEKVGFTVLKIDRVIK